MVQVIKVTIRENTHRNNFIIALVQSGYKVWMVGEADIYFEIGEPLPEDRPVIGNYRHKGEEDV